MREQIGPEVQADQREHLRERKDSDNSPFAKPSILSKKSLSIKAPHTIEFPPFGKVVQLETCKCDVRRSFSDSDCGTFIDQSSREWQSVYRMVHFDLEAYC